MAEYIEREAAKVAIVKAISKGHSPFNAIVMLPAADVRPVVRGKWEEVKQINTGMLDERIIWKCSNCGCEIITTLPLVCCDIKAWHFCPNCGADMREES